MTVVDRILRRAQRQHRRYGMAPSRLDLGGIWVDRLMRDVGGYEPHVLEALATGRVFGMRLQVTTRNQCTPRLEL